MNRSESIKEITKSLCEFQSRVKIVPFDKTNPFFKSRYATLTSVVERAQKELHAQGLSYIQSAEDGVLTTLLMHVSGEFLATSTPLILGKQDMQGVGAAMTYARRIGLIAILGLVADEDDDGESDKLASAAEVKIIYKAFKDKGMSDEDWKKFIQAYGYSSSQTIKASEIAKIKNDIDKI